MSVSYFKEYMQEVTQKLCTYIGVRKDTIALQIDTPPRSGVYYTATLTRTSRKNDTFPVFISSQSTSDPVVNAIMKNLAASLWLIKDLPLESTDVFFTDDTGLILHSPTAFSRHVYRGTLNKLFDDYGNLLNVDFALVSDIMSSPYESKQPKGSIAFTKHSATSDFCKRVLRVTFLPEDFDVLNLEGKKYIRKMLEGAGDDILVLSYDPSCEGGTYRCIGYADKKYLKFFPSYFSALGRDSWSFNYAGEVVFKVHLGNVVAVEDELQICLKLLATEIGEPNVIKTQTAIKKIAEQKHGTSIVFIDSSQGPVYRHILRLSKERRLLPIESIKLNASDDKEEPKYDGLTKIAAMDGAIIIDYYKGEIKYINAIVDGLAIVQGDPSGGARRNGLTCFIANLVSEYRSAKVAALIFSEDGGCKIVRGSDFRKFVSKGHASIRGSSDGRDSLRPQKTGLHKARRHVKYCRRAPATP